MEAVFITFFIISIAVCIPIFMMLTIYTFISERWLKRGKR